MPRIINSAGRLYVPAELGLENRVDRLPQLISILVPLSPVGKLSRPRWALHKGSEMQFVTGVCRRPGQVTAVPSPCPAPLVSSARTGRHWSTAGVPCQACHLAATLGRAGDNGMLKGLALSPALPSPLCENSPPLPSQWEMKCSFIGFYVGYKMFHFISLFFFNYYFFLLFLLSSRKHTNLWCDLGKSQSRGTQTRLCLVNDSLMCLSPAGRCIRI